MFLIERIEAIYSYGANKITRGVSNPTCPNFVTDFLWNKYEQNQAHFHQALINLLYSVEKLKASNEDISFFDTFLVEERTAKHFFIFLLLREIFQNITKIHIFYNGKLKTDPSRIIISKEVADEMLVISVRGEENLVNKGRSALDIFYSDKENADYYDLMDFLLQTLGAESYDPAEAVRYLFDNNKRSPTRVGNNSPGYQSPTVYSKSPEAFNKSAISARSGNSPSRRDMIKLQPTD